MGPSRSHGSAVGAISSSIKTTAPEPHPDPEGPPKPPRPGPEPPNQPKSTHAAENVLPGEAQMIPKRNGPPSALEFGPLRNLHRHGPNRHFTKLERNRIFSNPVSFKLARKCVSTTPVQCLNTCEKHPRRRSTPKCERFPTPWRPKRRPGDEQRYGAHYK